MAIGEDAKIRRLTPARILYAGLAVFAFLIAIDLLWTLRFMLVSVPPRSINSLPPDGEIISYFRFHREDIEELVARYRSYVPAPGVEHGQWRKLDDTPSLFKRADVKYVSEIFPKWRPDPYSTEAAQRYLVESTKGQDSAEYHTVSVEPANNRFRHNVIWKDIVSFPIDPVVKSGYLIGPLDAQGRGSEYPVFASLDTEPPLVMVDKCGFRKIEPQWFIRMCRIVK